MLNIVKKNDAPFVDLVDDHEDPPQNRSHRCFYMSKHLGDLIPDGNFVTRALSLYNSRITVIKKEFLGSWSENFCKRGQINFLLFQLYSARQELQNELSFVHFGQLDPKIWILGPLTRNMRTSSITMLFKPKFEFSDPKKL